jgi:hypothetical protein
MFHDSRSTVSSKGSMNPKTVVIIQFRSKIASSPDLFSNFVFNEIIRSFPSSFLAWTQSLWCLGHSQKIPKSYTCY